MRDPSLEEFPPRVPEALAELDRAIMLLGSRQTQDLRPKARTELELLVGAYPSTRQATAWKRLLKVEREERAELEG